MLKNISRKWLLLSFTIIVISIIALASIFFLIGKPIKTTKPPTTIFPLQRYNQNINHWLKQSDPDHYQPLIEPDEQEKHLKNYYNHLYATGPEALSPWSNSGFEKILGEKIDDFTLLECHTLEQKIRERHDNSLQKKPKRIGYAANFRPYSKKWLDNIIHNMNLKQFSSPIKFQPANRAITVKNLMARSLPTNNPFFYHPSLPGEGYPFDMLQESAVWVGTPVYIVGETLDHKWLLVLTPNYLAWVKSNGVAKADHLFIKKWQKYAKQRMVAITKTNLSIFDINNQYRFDAYIGTVFPGKGINKDTTTILIPVADVYHNAQIFIAKVSNEDAKIIPLAPTPYNFAQIISSLIGRPYGWGNMYFYNDCSSELKNLYTPFGIWLARNSSKQIKNEDTIDKSDLSVQDRLTYLMENGKKFTTLVYINGHIMMYLGNYPHNNENEPTIMTYQNTWGLKSKDGSFRSVIGKSVLLPLLATYPENPELKSQADQKHFIILHLDKSE